MEQPSKITTEKFNELYDSAVSFPGSEPPSGSSYLGSGQRSGETFYFYKGVLDEKVGEQILYGTKTGIEFAKEIEKRQKKRAPKSSNNYKHNSMNSP